MKKIWTLITSMLILTAVLTGCFATNPSKTAESPVTPVATEEPLKDLFKTVGDAMDVESPCWYGAWDDGRYVCCFEYGGTPVRLTADLSKDAQEQLDTLDLNGTDVLDRIAEIVRPLNVTVWENLADELPAQAELDALSGKTGQELLDLGYEYWDASYEQDDEVGFLLTKGPFTFAAVVDRPAEWGDPEYDPENAFPGMKIGALKYYGLSDSCTNPDGTEQ